MLRRIVNYCVFITFYVTELVGLNQEQQEICESLIKTILLNTKTIEIFSGRHLDQIIFCSILAVIIALNINDANNNRQMSYKSIIESFSKIKNSDNYLKQVFSEFMIEEKRNKKVDILYFYNEIFSKNTSIVKLIEKINNTDEYIIETLLKKPKNDENNKSFFLLEEETIFKHNNNSNKKLNVYESFLKAFGKPNLLNSFNLASKISNILATPNGFKSSTICSPYLPNSARTDKIRESLSEDILSSLKRNSGFKTNNIMSSFSVLASNLTPPLSKLWFFNF